MIESNQMKEKIRVRIAPSPTGYAHVGTAYTALFNYAFARHHGGAFVVRIEDSDKKRNVKGAEEKIYKALNWLGIEWDEGGKKGGEFGPYKISERLDIYQNKAKELLAKGMAYEDEGAIRFKNPGEDVGWKDAVRGKISFSGDQIKDFVILKSDGFPTYNFNVVIDDALMQITHIIRGEDHISNTPRQIALYKAFGFDVPIFAHHPFLLNHKRQKLSKRDAAVDIEAYKKDGYLPEAIVNFLCLMGWSHPKEKEVFSLEEFVKEFSIERVRESGAIFNIDKLNWLNGQYIQNLKDQEFIEKVKPFSPPEVDDELLGQICPLVKTRIKKFSEFTSLAGPLFTYPGVAEKDLLKKVDKVHLQKAYKSLKAVSDWELTSINKHLMEVISENDFKTGKFFMSLRISVFSQKITPPFNESIVIIGKEETLSRIKKTLDTF